MSGRRTPSGRRLGAGAGGCAGATGTENVNVEPSPTRLRTVSVPPRSSAICRPIARPRPVPPCVREIDASAWTNGSNTSSRSAGGMPGPVSVTATRRQRLDPSPAPPRPNDAVTAPASVNLSALPRRLVTTWRTFTPSVSTQAGRSPATVTASASPFAAAVGRKRSSSSVASRRSSSGALSTVAFPARRRAWLSIALTSAARLRLLAARATAISWCSGGRSAPASSSALPAMPLSGVPDLVGQVGEEAVLGLGRRDGLGTRDVCHLEGAGAARRSGPRRRS